MASDPSFSSRVKRKDNNDLFLILDASSVIQMAYLINPQDLERNSPRNPTLLHFIEHVGRLGAKIIIPESVVFETTGYRADGTQLTRQHKRDIEHDYLRGFFQAVQEGALPNVSIMRTPFADEHLAELEKLKDNHEEFNRYRRENLFGFGDRDIIKIFDESSDKGNIFVVTQDRNLTKELMPAKNKSDRPVGIMDVIAFCSAVQKAAPIPWLSLEVETAAIKGYLNDALEHENLRRIANKRKKRLNEPYGEYTKGFEKVAEGEPSFGQALYALAHSQQKGR